MNNQLKVLSYMRVGSAKQLSSGSRNLKDNSSIPSKVYEKKAHDQKYVRGIRETINYRKLVKSDKWPDLGISETLK